MQRAVVRADCVDIHCFWGVKELLFETLSEVNERWQEEGDKMKKMVIYVEGLQLDEYEYVNESMRNTFKELFEKYSINIMMMKNSREIEELL